MMITILSVIHNFSHLFDGQSSLSDPLDPLDPHHHASVHIRIKNPLMVRLSGPNQPTTHRNALVQVLVLVLVQVLVQERQPVSLCVPSLRRKTGNVENKERPNDGQVHACE